MEQVQILLGSGAMEERPHELAPLAAASVLQYKFSWAVVKKEQGTNRESGTSATTSLNDTEFREVTADLKQAHHQGHEEEDSTQREGS